MCVCIIAMGDAPHPSLTQPHHHKETLLRTGLDKNNLRLAKGAHLGLSPELFLPPNSYNLVVCVCVYVQLYDLYSPPSLPLSRAEENESPGYTETTRLARVVSGSCSEGAFYPTRKGRQHGDLRIRICPDLFLLWGSSWWRRRPPRGDSSGS